MPENNDVLSYRSNPRSFTIKKWFATLIKNRYSESDDLIIERVASTLVTDKDLEDFGKLMGKLYEGGYERAIEDVKGQVEEHGFNLQIKTKTVSPEV